MKLVQSFIIVLVLTLSCNQQVWSQNKDELELVDYPIWEPKDMEINKRKGGTVTYSHRLHLRPPFYLGHMPLEYNAVETSGRNQAHGNPVVLVHKFRDHDNLFVYRSGVLVGAVAVNKHTNKLVAEIKISYVNTQGKQVITMEEFHWGFPSKHYIVESKIDPSTGFKVKELRTIGTKKHEYFFILPFGANN